jgi:hypothetical protein
LEAEILRAYRKPPANIVGHDHCTRIFLCDNQGSCSEQVQRHVYCRRREIVIFDPGAIFPIPIRDQYIYRPLAGIESALSKKKDTRIARWLLVVRPVV